MLQAIKMEILLFANLLREWKDHNSKIDSLLWIMFILMSTELNKSKFVLECAA
jgi:hypothetical protein